MEEEMATSDELKVRLAEKYIMLQEIKAHNKEENLILDYRIREVEAQLHILGESLDDYKLK